MNKYLFIALILLVFITLPVSAAITTNPATVNASCVLLNGTVTGNAQSVWFDYGHSTNPGYSSSTPNQTKTGTFTVLRCNEPTFLPGETYHYRANNGTANGSAVNFTMNVLIPHTTETLSIYGQDFIDHGDNPGYLAKHIWDVYSLVWGNFFMLLLIAFVFMNVTIKQKSVALSLLLMLISGGALYAIAPMELQMIAQMLMVVAFAGLMYWLYKRKR